MILNENELVYFKDDNNNIMSHGYKINSIFLTNNISPITSIQRNCEESKKSEKSKYDDNDKVTDQLFNNLAIPSGLYFFNKTSTPFMNIETEHQDMFYHSNPIIRIDDDITDDMDNSQLLFCSNENEAECINNDLYEKLINIVKYHKINNKSKKINNNNKLNNKTKRSK